MITTEAHKDVRLITFDDQKVNVLNRESLAALKQALDEAEEARAVVLTGGAKCFSAGLDLKLLPTLSKEELFGVLEMFSEVIMKILHFPCPVVAAVNGHAIAGGAVMTLSCDQAIGVEKDLKVGLSEVAVGMPLPDLVVQLARTKLSPIKLPEAILFGKLYNWKEAMEVGYFHHTAPAEELVPRALAAAELLSKLPREAYVETKKSLYAHLPQKLGMEAVGSFLTEQAQKHMAKFNG